MLVNGINVLEELIDMLCLLDDKGVIHIPEPKPGWTGDSADDLASISSMNRLATRGLIGETMAAP